MLTMASRLFLALSMVAIAFTMVVIVASKKAKATHYIVPIITTIVAPTTAPVTTTPAVATHAAPSGAASGGAVCVAGCAWVAGGIGVVGGLIVGDKIKRLIEGPACATGKMRRSWFGMVRDDPELWLPKCKRHHRRGKKPVEARG